jgi:hypothetical protein
MHAESGSFTTFERSDASESDTVHFLFYSTFKFI